MRSVANVITLSSILRAGGSLEGDANAVVDSVNHLSSSLHALVNTSGGDYNWKQEMDSFYKSWSKLVTGSKDTVQDSELTFEEVNERATSLMKAGDFPAVIQGKKEEPV